MVALTGDGILGGRQQDKKKNSKDFGVANTQVARPGGFQALHDIGNATAADHGLSGPYTNEAGQVVLGEHLGPDPAAPRDFGSVPTNSNVTGDTTATIPPRADTVIEGRIYRNIAITGLAGDATDVTRLVYASNDNDLTLTPQARPEAIGVIIRERSATAADLYAFGLVERYAATAVGVERIWLSTEPVADLTITTGDYVTGFPMPCKGFLLAVGYVVTTDITGTPDTVIGLELGGTNVTDGDLALATGTAGDYAVGTTFASANHYFSRGALLDVEVASGTTGATLGAASFFVDVLKIPGC